MGDCPPLLKRRARLQYDGEYLATGALDNLARLWALDGTLKVVFRGHTAPVFGVRFSPSGKLVVTAGVDSLCIVWDAATGSKLRAFAGHSQAAMDVDWMSDTIYASVSCDKFCFVQDIDREEPLRQFSGHKVSPCVKERLCLQDPTVAVYRGI